MLDEDVETGASEATTTPRAGFSRRGFLQALGAITATTAVVSHVGVARAGNGWTIGLDGVPPEKLKEMYTLMLKSRWWEEGMKEVFLAGQDNMYGAFHISV